MKFQASGKYEQGVADPNPATDPGTILAEHIMAPRPSETKEPVALDLVLVGTGSESVTLDLYFLVETQSTPKSVDEYVHADAIWFQFATGVVVTNGTLAKVTANLPAGGVVYGRRTADSIGAGETRSLLMAWVPQ